VRLSECFGSVSCKNQGYVHCFVRAPEFFGEMAKNNFLCTLQGSFKTINFPEVYTSNDLQSPIELQGLLGFVFQLLRLM